MLSSRFSCGNMSKTCSVLARAWWALTNPQHSSFAGLGPLSLTTCMVFGRPGLSNLWSSHEFHELEHVCHLFILYIML